MYTLTDLIAVGLFGVGIGMMVDIFITMKQRRP